jgi:hypothetical protein
MHAQHAPSRFGRTLWLGMAAAGDEGAGCRIHRHAAKECEARTRAKLESDQESKPRKPLRIDLYRCRRRAVEAVGYAVRQRRRDVRGCLSATPGQKCNDIIYWSKHSDWKLQFTTPNASTYYVYFQFNLKDRPVVLDFPPAVGAEHWAKWDVMPEPPSAPSRNYSGVVSEGRQFGALRPASLRSCCEQMRYEGIAFPPLRWRRIRGCVSTNVGAR